MDCKEKLDLLQKEYDEFTYIISHDLKAPIRAITNLTEWIEDDLGDDIDPDIRINLDLLKGRAAKMDAMISAVTELSRINRREIDIVEVSFQDVFIDIKDDVEYRYPFVHITMPNEEVVVKTYAKKIERVLAEIVENAAKHNDTASPLEISISLKTNNDNVEISVEDNGKGVPEDQLSNITKMFYTLESKDKSKTLGAGLAIVKKMLDFVNGKIEFGNNNSKFQVKITWPLNIIKDDTKSE